MTKILEKRILQIISQTHAIGLEEMEKVYLEINSFDGILAIVSESNKNNISFERAFENWRVNK